MRRSIRRLAAAAALLMIFSPVGAYAQATGTSCADCPTSTGEFTIRNDTGFTIRYKVKWGDGPWNKANEIALATGFTETHSHPLDANRRAPAPHIRLDADTTARTEFRENELDFGAVDHVGFPHPGRRGEPVHYFFFVGKDKMLGLARE